MLILPLSKSDLRMKDCNYKWPSIKWPKNHIIKGVCSCVYREMNSAAKWAANPADKEHRVCQRS